MKLTKMILTTAAMLTAWLPAPQAGASVAFTNLASFTYTNPPDYGWNFGAASGHLCALVQGNDGNFYGTTWSGGDNLNGNYAYATDGNGTVFKMAPDGTFTSLHSFGSVFANNQELDGSHPVGNLLKGADGNLYGTTYYGGTIPGVTAGTIFEITTNGTLSSLYSFGHNPGDNTNADVDSGTNTDGENPMAGLAQGGDGNFYGTTSGEGEGGQGTVFQFVPGVGLNTLYSFPSSKNADWSIDGGVPWTELVKGSDGDLYGATYWGGSNDLGTLFRITTNGAFATVTSFSDLTGAPSGPLLLGQDGSFYAMADDINNSATFFKVTTNGTFTVLNTFYFLNGISSLILGGDGNFYAMAATGYYGSVIEISTNGTLTTLYQFSGPDGEAGLGTTLGALVQGADGSFYGTTELGGPYADPENPLGGGYGTIFRVTIPPAFQSISQTNGQITLNWSIMPGQTYQLQSTASLSSPNWLALGASATATNTTVTISDTIGANAQRFYRLALSQ